MAAAAKEGTPPPIIGKAGRLTVFLTPPATPKTPSPSPRPLSLSSGLSPSPRSSPENTPAPTRAVKASNPPPPVQVPPPQFNDKLCSSPSNSALGFLWEAVAKVQEAHTRLDEYLARWLGLNESKYQWALNDFHETNAMNFIQSKINQDLETGKSRDLAARVQST